MRLTAVFCTLFSLVFLFCGTTFAQDENYDRLLYRFIKDFSLDESFLKKRPYQPKSVSSLELMIVRYIDRGRPSDQSTVFELLEILKEANPNEYNETLGTMYANGDFVSKDCSMASYHFAGAGTITARHSAYMAEFFENCNEMGPNRRFQEAKFFAENGIDVAIAPYSLASMYINGEGVIQDAEQAYMWFLIAAASAPTDEMREFPMSQASIIERALNQDRIKKVKTEAQNRLDAIMERSKNNFHDFKRGSISYIYSVRPRHKVQP